MTYAPHPLFRASQVRELDRLAIEECGIPGYELMDRAGHAAFAALRRRWPEARRIGVVCGSGNNGGDGYVVARLAQEAGLDVHVLALGDPKGTAAEAAKAAADAGVARASLEAPLHEFDLIVDALLGIGLSGEVRGAAREMIARINASGVPVLAIDVPSGLDGDSGRVLGEAVRAQATITFIGRKTGLFTGKARDFCGDVLYDDLDVPPSIFQRVESAALLSDVACLREWHPRPRTAHKGSFGHVLVVGGDSGMAGAARMAAEAAGRVGAGLMSIATRAGHAGFLAATRPELMVHGAEKPVALAPLLARATVVAVGPGLGRGDWGRGLLAAVLDCQKPLVVDADALNLIAEEPARRERWVLTPHPGEAARLLGCTPADIEADRYSAAVSLQASFGGVVVLKGAGTLVADVDGRIDVCAQGNPGMASGGMGDVLTGVIAGLVAQGLELGEAARLGVCLHGAAGDRAAGEGERGMLATDLMPFLRRLANP